MNAKKTARTSVRPAKPASVAASTTWEYRVAKALDRTGLDDQLWLERYGQELSKLGSEGWELCAQTPTGHLILKRSK